MPKFLVTASVDAFANYQTVIHAADETEAREAAESEWESNSLAWQQTSVSEFDHVDFDNIPPEMVADDFKLEPEADLTAEILAALRLAVEHLEMNNYDHEEDSAIAEIQTAIEKVDRR